MLDLKISIEGFRSKSEKELRVLCIFFYIWSELQSLECARKISYEDLRIKCFRVETKIKGLGVSDLAERYRYWTFSSWSPLIVIYRRVLSIHLSVLAGPCSNSVYLLPLVSDGHLTSSSTFDLDYGPESARLNASTGWAPDVLDDSNPWVQVPNTDKSKSKR